jgi:hypothetical protein
LAKQTSTKAVVAGLLGGAVTVGTALQGVLTSQHVTVASVSSLVTLVVTTVLTTAGVYFVPNADKEKVVKVADTATEVVKAVDAGVDQAYDPAKNPAKNPPPAA